MSKIRCISCHATVEQGPTGNLVIDGRTVASADGLDKKCFEVDPNLCAAIIVSASSDIPPPRREKLTDSEILAQLKKNPARS